MLKAHLLEAAKTGDTAIIGGADRPTSIFVTSGVNIWGVLAVTAVAVISCCGIIRSRKQQGRYSF